MNDYAREINAARAAGRRRALARCGVVLGVGVGAVGLGALFGLSSGAGAAAALVLLGWFWWGAANTWK